MPPALYPGRFVGRRADLARITERFAAGARLVTLLGPGGVGKTRLAVEFGAAARGGAGAWFCDLAEARTVHDACLAVLRALELPSAPWRGDPVEHTARVLAARGATVGVLDNFEQLVPAAAHAVAAWLRAAPDARFVATSRLPLGIDGEARVPIEPLGLPAGPADARDSEAVQLFLDRALAQDARLADDAAALARVAELVRRLEGIPLAIELAAARAGVLGLDGLLARLPGQLDVLAKSGAARAHRHGTLRAAIEWSWRLLEPDARRALAQCAVFRGGFQLDAAEGVLALGPDPRGVAALDALQALRDHSLLRTAPVSGGRVRFALFEAIREFADDQLARSDEAAKTRDRHRAHFAALARRVVRGDEAAPPRDAALLVAEHENLAAAFEHALAGAARAPVAEEALALALALDAVLALQGEPARRVELLDAALAAIPERGPEAALVARVHRARGRALHAAGRLDAAEEALGTALRAATRARDRTLRGALLLDLGVLHHARRELDRARHCYAQALEIHAALGPRVAEGRTLGNLGALHHDVREFDAARGYYARALAIFREVGDARLEGLFLTNLGLLDAETQRPEDARARFERAARMLALVGDGRLWAITEGNHGMLLHELGEPEAAREKHERAARSLRAVGDARSEGLALARLGAALADLGRGGEARDALDASEALLARGDDPLARHVLALSRALVDVLPARGKTAAAAPRIAEAREAVDRARAAGPRGGPSAADLSDDVRAMLRLVEQAVTRADPVRAAGVALPEEALAVGPEAAWFRPPRGRWQDLRRHGAQRAILAALVAQHRAGGPTLSLDALREVAWPGLKLRPDAANHRVYVALSSLRTRGLAAWLVRESEGYLLARSLEVCAVDAPPPEEPPRARRGGRAVSGSTRAARR